MSDQTLTALMQRQHPADRAIHYHAGENQVKRVTYAELYQRALGMLHHLQALGARPGDHLILLLNNNEQFIDAFWGAILGGIVPVPVAIGISDEHRRKLLRIARKLGQPFIFSDRKTLERVGQFVQQAGDATLAATFAALRPRAFVSEDVPDLSKAGAVHEARPEDTAFIQFSSGSTSEPKGVVLTHANLMAHSLSVNQAGGFNENDTSLSWMPLTHDMGLIGFHLVMFAARVNAHLMPTELFVRRPLLWLTIASDVRATILCSPNFGYRHYLKVLDDRSPGNLDLSSVRLIFNGAEPISVELCEEFMARLAGLGLKRTSMFPVYGLAEASLAATFPPVGRHYRTLLLDRHHLGVGVRAQVVGTGSRDAVALVSVAQPIPRCQLRICGDDDAPLADGTIGHIHIRGENVTGGYFREPEINAATFTADGWLRTGDLARVDHEGYIFIVDRKKEMLVSGGFNIYPSEVESVLSQHPAVYEVCVVGVPDDHWGETVKAVVVLREGIQATADDITGFCKGRLADFKRPRSVDFVPALPKNSNGKMSRKDVREKYWAGRARRVN